MIFDTSIHCSSHLMSSSLDILDAFKPRMKQHSLSASVDKVDGPPSRTMARSIRCNIRARCDSRDFLNQNVETSCIPQRDFWKMVEIRKLSSLVVRIAPSTYNMHFAERARFIGSRAEQFLHADHLIGARMRSTAHQTEHVPPSVVIDIAFHL